MLENLDLLQVFPAQTSDPGARAVRFAAGIARRLGAKLYLQGNPPASNNAFYKEADSLTAEDPFAWASAAPPDRQRIILFAADAGTHDRIQVPSEVSAVFVELEPWQSEATLFAGSGIAHLLGDPARKPLVPAANFAAHTIGYAAFAALANLYVGRARGQAPDCAVVHGLGVMVWANWKAAIAGSMGNDICREGPNAEWPILPCKDGHVAFLYTERDWPAVAKLIGDPVLEEERFSTFKGRQENRDTYMRIIADWCLAHTKADITEGFHNSGVPGAALSTVGDLLTDPLVLFRNGLETAGPAKLPVLPHRVARAITAESVSSRRTPQDQKPLSGLRVLDLGIITAGAGVSALLADLGAEVIKVESQTYPDPFRQWAGSSVSPLFKSNNRNKYGIALDLKTKEGRAHFLELAKTADIVVENFRRGVLDRLGLTFDTLRAANPNILVASISGQGLEGPGFQHATFGTTHEASSGFGSLTCYEDGLPYVSGRNLNYPDQIVCLYGAAMIALAAYANGTKNCAQHIDVSQRDCTIYQLGDAIATVSTGTKDDAPSLRTELTSQVLAGVFTCSDGNHIALTAQTHETLEKIDGLSDITQAGVQDWASKVTSQKASRAFLKAGGGAMQVRKGSDFFDDPILHAAQILTKSPAGELVKGYPFCLARAVMDIRLNAPDVGEHTRQFTEDQTRTVA